MADRPALTDEVQITPAMIEAGVEVFRAWFAQPHLEPLLPSMPDDEDIRSLVFGVASARKAHGGADATRERR